MIYISTPYTDPDPIVREARYLKAAEVLNFFIRRDDIPFSPIVMCHPIAELFNLPVEEAFWKRFDEVFISRSDEIVFVDLLGWEESKGMFREYKFAKEINRRMLWFLYPEMKFSTINTISIFEHLIREEQTCV